MPARKRRRAPPLRASVAADLYRRMLAIRLAEQKIIELYPSDKIQSPIHLSVGQEAIAAGLCAALTPSDHIHATYRGHGLYVAKGGDLKKMFAELYGKETGCAKGRGGSMHLIAPEVGLTSCSAIVASTIPIATGDALAAQMQGDRRLACAVFGDGAIDEGVFFESVNFAVLKRLPILYVLENNGYAVHSPVSDRHRQTELWRIAEGLGLPGERHDGSDVFGVYAAVSKAAAAIRKGSGPRLLEFTAFRWHEHVGPGTDFEQGYRAPGEKRRASAADPLRLAKDRLLKSFRTDPLRLEAWETDLRRQVDQAVEFAERSPFPAPETLCDDAFAEAA